MEVELDIRQTIKDILDRDCATSKNGKCKDHLVYTGILDKPDKPNWTFNMCYLCHKNDMIAKEIAELLQQ